MKFQGDGFTAYPITDKHSYGARKVVNSDHVSPQFDADKIYDILKTQFNKNIIFNELNSSRLDRTQHLDSSPSPLTKEDIRCPISFSKELSVANFRRDDHSYLSDQSVVRFNSENFFFTSRHFKKYFD